MSDVKADVDRGARIMDEKAPGWWKKIDVDLLNISSCRNCIIGQTFGMFGPLAFEKLGLPWECETIIQHGFSSVMKSDLQEACWIEAINERRKLNEATVPKE